MSTLKPRQVKEAEQIQANDWCERQGTVPCWGLGASDAREHEGSSGEAKFPFLDLNASYMGVLEHSWSCTLLTGAQFCVFPT